MAEKKLCEACGMYYDWEGVEVQGYEYCCEACSRGEECTCPQHDHHRLVPPDAAGHAGD